MSAHNPNVSVELTVDEAHEILTRCLLASGEDTKCFRDALRKLAFAIERASADEISVA